MKSTQNKNSFFRRILLLCTFSVILSLQAAAEDNKAVIEFKQTPLNEAFKKVTALYKVQFTYDPAVIQRTAAVSMERKERTLQEVLDKIAEIANLKFIRVGEIIGVQKSDDLLQRTDVDIVVRGKVSDANNQPLAGVSVNNKKNNSKGTVTDENGLFTITVEKGEVIVISYVGFESQEYIIENDASLSVKLTAANKTLEEVLVTTALGIKKEKRKTTYAMQEVKGTALEKAREPNVLSNLTGKVAGLSIQSKTTMYENPEVKLRGGSTILVVDGVPVNTDFWNINPDDIDNVNVLKGTAATALYGSLGINGAIMITTKKGKTGANGVEVTVNSTNQFQAGFIKIPEAQTEYGMGWKGQYAFQNGKGAGWYDDYGYVYGPKLNQRDPSTTSGFVEIPQYNGVFDPNNTYTTTFSNGDQFEGNIVPKPWITRSSSNLKKFLQNEFLTTNNVSIAGKNDKGEYRISFTHMFQQGQVPNTHVNATTLNMGGSLKVSEKLRVEATMSYNRQYSPNYPTTGYGPDNFFYNVLLWMGPEVDINDMRNYWVPGKEGIEQKTYNYTWYNNPWFLAYERTRSYNRDAIITQANAVYDFSKDLSVIVRSGATINNTVKDIRTPWSFINYGNSKAPNGNYEVTNENQFRIVTDALLTYKKDFLRDFNVNITAGASSRYDQFGQLYSTTNGLSVPGVYNLGNSINPVRTTNVRREKQVNSLLGNAELSFKNQVYLSVSGRNDWTSSLQKPYNSFFYPSASLGLIISEMVKMPEVISFWKLRGSWANLSTDFVHISDDVPDEYASLPVYINGTRWNNQSSLNLPGRLLAPNLRPNKTISQEYGTEIRFLKNRLGIDITYYTYLDKDFVARVPISAASGYNELVLNGDKVNRHGIELILSGSPVRTNKFRWDVLLNYSRHRSIQKEFHGGQEVRDLVRKGSRTDILRGYKWDRSPDGEIVHVGGIPQYVNARTRLGNTDPDWEFGVSNSFSYKNISLSFQFDGRIGGALVNGVEAKLYEGGMHKSTANQYRDDAYNGLKTYVAKGVVATSGTVEYDAFGNKVKDDRKFSPNTEAVNYIDWVFPTYTNGIDESIMYKRTFVKLREVVLTYNLGPKWLMKTPFKTANLSIVGRNLFLFTDVPFMDPDGYSGLTLAEPSYRNIGVNLNLKF